MLILTAFVTESRSTLNEPVDLPEGTQLKVTVAPQSGRQIDEDGDEIRTPEEIEAEIAAMDAIPSTIMSDDDWAAWHEWRRQERNV